MVSTCIYVPPVWNSGDTIYGIDPIEEGSTTKEEILEMLGEPNSQPSPDIIRYEGQSDHGFACMFIFMFGGCNLVNEKSWWVEITFDENGVVESVLEGTKPKPEFAIRYRMTCASIRYTPLKQDVGRVGFGSFSIDLPQDPTWCAQRSDLNRVAIVSHPWIGQDLPRQPDQDSLMNIFILVASHIRLRPEDAALVKSDLLAFVGQWFEGGSEIELANANMIADFRETSLYRLIDHYIAESTVDGQRCVNYRYNIEERENLELPGSVLLLKAEGLICRDPLAADKLIGLNFSERYILGHQVDVTQYEKLRTGTVSAFFESLRFTLGSPG